MSSSVSRTCRPGFIRAAAWPSWPSFCASSTILRLALALDTGHANLTATAAEETLAAGSLLATTHVHDNNGRQDSHEPPGHGTVDWADWGRALDQIRYGGPILLECIRSLRHNPSSYRPEVLAGLVGGTPGALPRS